MESVKVNLIHDGFAQADLTPSTLVFALRDKKKDYLSSLGRATSTIKDYVNASLYPILERKTPPKICSILLDRFYHIFSISNVVALTNGCIWKLLEYKNVVDYISSYQMTLNEVVSLTKIGSHIYLETAKIML